MNKFSIMLALGVVIAVSPLAAGAEPDCTKAAQLVREATERADGSKEEEQNYRDAITACPDMAEAHYNLGVLLLGKQELDPAEAALRRAIELRDDPQFHGALGNTLIAKHDYIAAEKELTAALENGRSSLALLQGLALLAQQRNDLPASKRYLEQARAIRPDDGVTNLNLGAVYFREGSHGLAAEAYRRALKLEPENDQALFYLGLSLRAQGDLEGAVVELQRAASLKPSETRVQQALGSVYENLREYDKAEVALRRAFELNPGESSTQINLAVVLIRKQQEGLAEELLQPLAAREPKNARAHAVLGWAALELGKYKEAESALRRAIQLDELDAFTHNNLGVLYERLGRTEDARREFDAARKIDPKLEAAEKNLATFDQSQG